MKKIKTLLLFICLISLIHNSFLIRLSIIIGNNTSTVSYGLVFVFTILFIILTNYSVAGNLNKQRFQILGFSLITMLVFLLMNYFFKDEYNLKDAVLLRFPFLFLFMLIFPLRHVSFDEKFFIKLSKYYFAVNIILGLAQSIFNKTIISTEFYQEPYVNTIFFKEGFSTKYSYILDYGGKVRAFGFFDSGLTLGLFIIFFVILYVNKIIEKRTFSNIFMLIISFVTIYFTHTRNVFVILGITLVLLLVFNYKKNRYQILFFSISVFFGNLITLFLDKIFNEGSLFIGKFNAATLISRGNLMENAFSQLNTLDTILFGVGVQNIQTIDNDFIYIVYYGGLITYIMVLMAYVYTLKIAIVKNNKTILDKTVILFLMTYPFASIINYVSNVYLVVSVFYLIINLSKIELKSGEKYEENFSL